MPRYFFTSDGLLPASDNEGTELENLEAARIEAIRMAGEILTYQAADFAGDVTWRVTVHDASRRPMFALRFTAESFG